MIEASDVKNPGKYRNWFLFIVAYLVIDYGRPQDVLPIGALKPGMIVIAVLSAFLVFSGKLRDAKSKQTRLLLLFIVLLGVFIPFAENNYFAYRATETMVLFMPFILSTIICVNSIEYLKKLIFVLVLIMIYVSGYSLTHGGKGSGNYFQDENDLSLYINMYLPFCFFLFTAEKDKVKKIMCGIGLVVGIAAIIVSFSRGGLVGLICTAIIAWLYSPKKLTSLALICVFGLAIYFYAGDAYWNRMATAKNTDEGTAAERIESWKSGWNMFLDNPLGVGGNNFPVRFGEYQTNFFNKVMWGRQAHSLWFTLLPELGIIGVLIYGSLLYCNIADINFMRKLKDSNLDLKYIHALSAAFLASIVGFCASGTFLSVLYYPHYWYLTAIIVASANVARQSSVRSEGGDRSV